MLRALAGSGAPSGAAAVSAVVPAAQPQSVAIMRPPRERMAAQGRPPRPKADAVDPMDPVSTCLQHHACHITRAFIRLSIIPAAPWHISCHLLALSNGAETLPTDALGQGCSVIMTCDDVKSYCAGVE